VQPEAPLAAGAVTAALASLGASDELQSLLVALVALGVRELIDWLARRRRRSTLNLE
jgi:hypothetical protein